MAEPHTDKPKLPLTSMLALVAVVSGLLVSQVPLKTSRPISPDAEHQVLVGDDRVQSRLWQDPFEAVDAHLEEERKRAQESPGLLHGSHDLKELARKIHLNVPENTSFIMMLVMVDGSPYSNGMESRLRHRYALVSGLGASEYLPEAAEYVRFFQWNRKSCDQSHCPTLNVPVEWYKPKPSLGKDAPQILIIWLKGQDFSDTPLAGLAQLVTDLRSKFNQGDHDIKILGPRGSGGLAAMVKEVTDPSSALQPLKDVEIFSSWATAEDTFLIGDYPDDSDNTSKALEDPPPCQQTTVVERFSCAGISLYRTIGNDAILAEQLIKELKLRGVDLAASCSGGECPPHVALISEWDSLYGRVLPATVIAVAENQGSGQPDSNLAAHIKSLRQNIWPPWAHHYSYLAGLDGELPPKANGNTSSGSSSKDTSDDKAKRAALGMELPEGRGQLDYVRRLAKTMQNAEADIPGGYRAIGVLGSDVYDKLLILQALRPSFPRAIFFTTDLDALLAHPDQWTWTRNLVIASHFGLALSTELQQSIPPFRDSYQTALFFTVLQALQEKEKREVFNEDPPRVYEIGRHGPFDLSAQDKPNDPPNDQPRLHPTRRDLDPFTNSPGEFIFSSFMMIGGACVLILICVMLISSQVWNVFFNLVTKVWFWAVAVGIAGMLIGLIRWAMSDGADGEPFALTEGISVWATQMIRVFSFFLCGAFFLYSGWSLRKNETQLRETFKLPPLPEDVPQQSWLHRLIGIHDWCPKPSVSTIIQRLWLDYLGLGRWQNRWMRYSVQALLYLGFGGLLMQLFGMPHTPCRGSACFSINIVVLIAGVLSMVLLIFFVVDATRLCRRLIKHLVEGLIQWPDEFLEREAKRRGVHKEFVHEWLCIDFIAQRTAVIGHLIYYPFVIVFLMYVARHQGFDRWDLPLGLIILITLNVIYAFGNAVWLRWSAEHARRTVLSRLNAKLLPLNNQRPVEKASKYQLERAIDAIKHNQDGAFLPLTAHPIFGAIALPSGGIGLMFLMEYLANTF
jgi:hypothetical protein